MIWWGFKTPSEEFTDVVWKPNGKVPRIAKSYKDKGFKWVKVMIVEVEE